MARQEKQGLGYFPLDTDLSQDIKIKKIKARYGFEGKSIIVELFGNIYASNGYYMPWDDEVMELLAMEEGINQETLKEVLQRALEVGIFNQDMFNNMGILTSKAIQKRFIQATKSKRKTEYISEYLLISLKDIQEAIVRKTQKIKIIDLNGKIIQELTSQKNENSDNSEEEKNEENFNVPSVNGTRTEQNGKVPNVNKEKEEANGTNHEKSSSKYTNMKVKMKYENESESESVCTEKNVRNGTHTHTPKFLIEEFIEKHAPNIRRKMTLLNNKQSDYFLRTFSKPEVFQILSEINEHPECGRKYTNLTTTMNKFFDAKNKRTRA